MITTYLNYEEAALYEKKPFETVLVQCHEIDVIDEKRCLLIVKTFFSLSFATDHSSGFFRGRIFQAFFVRAFLRQSRSQRGGNKFEQSVFF